MSLIQRGILEAMSVPEPAEDNGLNAEFLFPKEFIGFQGHFENNPILPGICKIQAVIVMYEKFHNQKKFFLTEVMQAKYFLPVTCDQKITIQCHSKSNSEGRMTIKALIKRGEEKVSMLQLIIQAQP